MDDVARLTVALMRGGAGGAFNVATGRSRSFAQVVEALRKLVPYEVDGDERAPQEPHHPPLLRHCAAGPGRARLPVTPLDEGLRATLAAFGAL